MLAKFATRAENSRGRLFVEDESAHRSAFQRDRDRIIHSSAFRRLKHKTQVFVEHEGDYFRTRLTHSIEVAQVARTIARTLGLNEDLTEAVALAHDLGHTPFGHTGEDALAECMAPYGGFDHNAQAIKIVTMLERHYADFNGLNLTWEALEGIAKHNGPVLGDVPAMLAEYSAKHDLELGTYASAEAQVAAISDDIAYNNHDLDDGLRAGLFSETQIRELPIIGACYDRVEALYPDLDHIRRRHEALRRVFGVMVEDVLAESRRLLAEANPQSVDDVRMAGRQLIGFSDGLAADLKLIRAFFFKHMYRHWKVRRMRRKAGMIVQEMFGIFMEDPGMLPDGWQDWAQKGDATQRAWVVADYIAGMTDRFALQEYEKLTDPMTRA
ncbi:deoxyguanosinetriphosphate triphosphohydrolase [Abyssibius alkaniclasticus]|uniref:deoxyguanosinetriphosphate triphosphohydrolase n=1 Tax=Abyssibius alkaniclasticus TaxID=2881234 RepID=UPI002364716B|nr:deoxyguanosinetriphosphate triphosphohydrolase [Abyssibius alkaniclasticus]UPH70040.1 deoxyguanosinetriphosphate triphosphohydrolase [Abyssibius alkaniclasticus]